MGYAFISYSSKDRSIVNPIIDILVANGINTWIAPDDIPAGSNYLEVINDAIKNSSLFVVILTSHSQQSLWLERELERAITYEKSIAPIIVGDFKFNDIYQFLISDRQIIHLTTGVLDSNAKQSLMYAVQAISNNGKDEYEMIHKQRLLYSQIMELQHGDAIHFCNKICELLVLLVNEYRDEKITEKKINILYQVLELYKIYFKNGLSYGNEYKSIATRLINTLNIVNDALDIDKIFNKKTLFAAVAITILEEDHRIRNDCIDTLTTGDVHGEQTSIYMGRRSPFIPLLMAEEYEDFYTEDELRFIDNAKEKIINNSSVVVVPKKETSSVIDSRFEMIADYFSKGNELLNLIGQDNAVGDFYSCLLMSYERLKNYCYEVGEKRVFGECVIKISELKQIIAKIDREKNQLNDAERGIKALLGLTIPKSGIYDVFISYKHYDEDRALSVYNFLQKHLKESFFDKVSLPELSKSDYEHAVMTALGNSKHFIVIISDIKILEGSDFIEGDWVRREMRTFNTEIQEGRKKKSNFLILASDEVCDQIFAKNKENIDIMWHCQEVIRFSEFESMIIKYIN